MRLLSGAGTLAIAASLLVAPAAVSAHGGEDEAAAEAPARTLVQQALALLTQVDDPAEASEKLEAALTSTDKEGVDIASVEEALAALEKGDRDLAVEHLNAALGAAEGPEAPAEQAAPPGEAAPMGEEAEHEEGVPAAEEAEAAEGAFEHADEFDPEQGSAEWVALIVGIVLAGAAIVLLAIRRHTV